MACELCDGDGGDVLWQTALLRVVAVDSADFPGFCRVVLNRHVPEMTDLPPSERADVMRTVFAVEAAVRRVLAPDKMNLASLGNVTPHLHWHVIPRWRDDSRFPDPIWCAARRSGAARRLDATTRAALSQAVAAELAAAPAPGGERP